MQLPAWFGAQFKVQQTAMDHKLKSSSLRAQPHIFNNDVTSSEKIYQLQIPSQFHTTNRNTSNSTPLHLNADTS